MSHYLSAGSATDPSVLVKQSAPPSPATPIDSAIARVRDEVRRAHIMRERVAERISSVTGPGYPTGPIDDGGRGIHGQTNSPMADVLNAEAEALREANDAWERLLDRIEL